VPLIQLTNQLTDHVSEAADAVLAELTRLHEPVMQGSVGAKVAAQAQAWAADTRKTVSTQWPHAAQAARLDEWVAHLSTGTVSPQALASAVQAFVDFCRLAEQPANERFWSEQLSPSREPPQREASASRSADLLATSQLLVVEWRKALDKLHSQWALHAIRQRRAELLKCLQAQLDLMATLGEPLEALGLDPGVLVDLSRGRWSAHDVAEFRRWAQYLADDEGLKALCERLGRLREPASSDRLDRVSLSPRQEVWQTQCSAREEMVGIRLGRDLEHALPSELALLADGDTALLFDLKYVESRLMCFDMIGLQRVLEQRQTEELVRVAEVGNAGPMVICVDTSGSMEGMPETVAKAVVLFLVTQARSQRRACHLLNFSTGIQSLDLGVDKGMSALMDFLQMSFHGGTDVAPALRHALRTMHDEAYENADLLVISDFVMGRLPRPVLDDVQAQRDRGSQFHALLIGSEPMAISQSGLFDQVWVHNPETGGVHELPGHQAPVRSFSSLSRALTASGAS
jgi:uncharacterized protein with von Willebrand factor type A (vWA) domain